MPTPSPLAGSWIESGRAVGVQELSHACAGEISKRFEHTDLHPTDDPHGMGIATRQIAAFDQVPLPHTNGWRATLVDGTQIVTVHIRNPIDIPPLEANRERRRQIEALVAHVARSSGRLAIIGDFNATPAWPAYRRIAAVLDDAVARAVGPAAMRLHTWGPRRLGGRKLLRIDHVFTRRFEPVEARVVGIPGSDHSAVVVDLE